MSDLVQLTKDNDIAIITINNPPVNALSPGVPEGISDSIAKINEGIDCRALSILIHDLKTFSLCQSRYSLFGKLCLSIGLKANSLPW